MLHKGIHPQDLRMYSNSVVAKKYSVSERTVLRARAYTGIPYENVVEVEFTEAEYRQNSRKKLAEKLNTTEYYIRKYASDKGWRKR